MSAYQQTFEVTKVVSRRVFATSIKRVSGHWMDYTEGSGWLEDMVPGSAQDLESYELALSATGDLSVEVKKGNTPHDLWFNFTLVAM